MVTNKDRKNFIKDIYNLDIDKFNYEKFFKDLKAIDIESLDLKDIEMVAGGFSLSEDKENYIFK